MAVNFIQVLVVLKLPVHFTFPTPLSWVLFTGTPLSYVAYLLYSGFHQQKCKEAG